LGDWTPSRAVIGEQTPDAARSLLDRWILSRAADMASVAGSCMDVYDTRGATRAISEFVDDLSQWWLRRSRRRLSRGDDATDQNAAFGTMHLALMAVARTIAPLLPFLAEEFHRVLVASTDEDAPESVHLTAWPTADLAPLRDEALEAAMADLRRAVELGRTLRSQAGIRVRQPAIDCQQHTTSHEHRADDAERLRRTQNSPGRMPAKSIMEQECNAGSGQQEQTSIENTRMCVIH